MLKYEQDTSLFVRQSLSIYCLLFNTVYSHVCTKGLTFTCTWEVHIGFTWCVYICNLTKGLSPIELAIIYMQNQLLYKVENDIRWVVTSKTQINTFDVMEINLKHVLGQWKCVYTANLTWDWPKTTFSGHL
jgi:hypothetical protein